ncbi:MAG: ATP-dependent sacrificial sulfur transferase LarE [Eubacteriaceae bacterium]|nr:ATP-dependent sacrificial sulfur transferase LarE [Eubacteriaceae bacterium]
MDMQDKLKLLKDKIRSYDRLAIAFSGGVDSTFLLLAANSVLGSGALAVTASAPHFAPDELQEAKQLCEDHDIPQLVISLDETVTDTFAHNPVDRCYICKKAMFSFIKEALGDMPLADGTNADDKDDYRPGRRALKELGVISPLEEVGFTKAEIRKALAAMNIKIWDKPAYACLASRIPYGEMITPEKLAAVYRAEKALKELGFTQVRVRHHGDVARIEVLPEERHKFFDEKFMDRVNEEVKKAGFTYAALDLGGYVKGSLNSNI